MRLKCDFHMHTSEDPRHQLSYSARDLIEKAAKLGYNAISITNHNKVTYSPELADFASSKGVLLIPGVEATVMGKHVLIYGVEGMKENWGKLTLFDLKRIKARGAFIIAPHPFYPSYNCLGGLLKRLPRLFDAVEYSHLYVKKVNFNLRAQRFARKNGLPLIGLSDAHSLKQLDYTYTLIDSAKDPASIFEAIRQGRTTIVTRPAKVVTSGIVGIKLFSTFLFLLLLNRL